MKTHSIRNLLASNRREGAVSVLFATAVVAMLMIVGLSVDYAFYDEAEMQLNMAADAAAMHAVRVAVQAIIKNQSNYVAQGQAAGQQWFLAQAGTIPQAKVVNTPSISVGFNSSNNLVTAQVSYTGVVATHFGGIFPAVWTNWPNLGVAGGATAVQSAETYIQINFLLDNSSSMLIAADNSGIGIMNQITPCSTQAAGSLQNMDGTYSWVYNTTPAYGGPNNNSSSTAACATSTTYVPYGFGTMPSYQAKINNGNCGGSKATTAYANELVPPTNTVQGGCDSRFSGGSTLCPYVPQLLNLKVTATTTGSYAQCVDANGQPRGGITTNYYPVSPTTDKTTVKQNTNTPAAPCAFACHWTSSLQPGTNYTNDYYGLARQNNITLRFDVVQNAAETVVNDLINYLPQSLVPAPFSVGVYTFGNSLTTVYSPPSTPVTTASAENTELSAALSAIQAFETPVVTNDGDTNWPAAMTSMAGILNTSGNGTSSANARVNLFIVTDGSADYVGSSGRVMGPIDPSYCTTIKNMGVTIYVLYTEYYPLPNEFYLGNIKSYAEPTANSQITAALQSCASYPSTFFQASDSASINAAMQQMLKIALSSPGRLSQ
jgi:Flp pilus assembly protein TadG